MLPAKMTVAGKVRAAGRPGKCGERPIRARRCAVRGIAWSGVALPCQRAAGHDSAAPSIGADPRATAQVARRDRRLGTSRTPSLPQAASAAASATPQQPVARNAAADRSDRRLVSASRRAAAKNRAGTPNAAATARIPGSVRFSSIEATAATAPGISPASANVASTSAAISAAEQPRSAPDPEHQRPAAGMARAGWRRRSARSPQVVHRSSRPTFGNRDVSISQVEV